MTSKRYLIPLLLVMLCLAGQLLYAQDDDLIVPLATSLDQAASANGLPTGDGQISAVERSYASALIDDVTGYSEIVAEFEQSSPENASMVADMEAGYLNVQKDLPVTDPNEPALRQAIKDYKQSVADAGAEAARQALLEVAKEFLGDNPPAYENTVKKHVTKVIDDEFESIPEERLDSLSGFYTFGPNDVSYSGDCSDDLTGENGGTDRDYSPDDPMFQVQVCYSYLYGLVSVGSEMFRWYGDGTPNTYQSDITIDSFDNSSRQKFLTVIDEANFDVTMVSTSGTCTRTSTTHYTLYAPGTAMGCNPNAKVWVVNGEPVDVETGNPPSEEEEIIIDPIIAGEYAVAWMPFDPTTCAQDYAPTFNTVTLNPVSFDEVNVTAGGQTFSFGGSGMNEGLSGNFDMYEGDFSGSLQRRFATDFYFNWQAVSPDNSESCSAQGMLTLGTASADQPVFDPPVVGGQDGQGDSGTTIDPDIIATPLPFVAPESGTYNASAMLIPGMGCPADYEAQLPDITQVTLDVTDTEMIFTAGAETFTLAADVTGYSFYKVTDDNSGMAVAVSGLQDGVIYASYTVYTPDSDICMLSLTLSQ
jgi:hypothetical protein